MSTVKTTYDGPTLAGELVAHHRTRALLGQMMGLVAVAVGFAALGAYLGRDLSGATVLVDEDRDDPEHDQTQQRPEHLGSPGSGSSARSCSAASGISQLGGPGVRHHHT